MTESRRDGTVIFNGGDFLDGTGRSSSTGQKLMTGRDGTGRRDQFDDGFTVPSRPVPPLPPLPSRQNTVISLGNMLLATTRGRQQGFLMASGIRPRGVIGLSYFAAGAQPRAFLIFWKMSAWLSY